MPTTVLSSPGGEEILLGDGPRSVRISVATGSLLAGPARLSYRVSGTDALDIRLLALRRFAALQRSGRFPKTLFEPCPRTRRWAELVKTLEALAMNPSQRDVANQLYGDARVTAEWHGTSDYLRSRVRRAIVSTRQLAAGGYLSLLRQ